MIESLLEPETAGVIQNRERISVEPTPEWVKRSKVRSFERKNGAPATSLLCERRIHVPLRTIYSRDVTRLEGSQAVQQLSRVEIPFDPQTRSLAIHSIAIFRNGSLINHANRSQIELIRREQRLEEGIVNGELSALLLLKDVRIGDVLDVEYSIKDESSLFRDEMSWFQSTRQPHPVGAWNLVWMDVPERVPRISGETNHLEYREEVSDGLMTRGWSGSALEALVVEPGLPADVFGYPHVQITGFEDWGGISRTLMKHWNFEPESRLDLDEELEAIRTMAGDDPEKRVEGAVNAARDAVRYQNYSPGLLAMTPENLSVVWGRRFGDCKEKTLLLTWLLRELGIDATPVLVGSVIGKALPRLLPSPALFDHVVTRVTLDDRVLWIDPTDAFRGGPPSSWAHLPFGWGLPLEGDANDLVEIPGEKNGETFLEVRERITASNRDMAADLEIRLEFGGKRADWIRGMMDGQGMAGLEKALTRFFEPTRKGIELEENPEYIDDREANRISMVLKGRQPEAIREATEQQPDRLPIAPFSFAGLLTGVERVKRIHPLWIGNPDRVEHQVEVVHPLVTEADYAFQSVENPAFKVEAGSRLESRIPVFKFSYVLLKDRIEPAAVAKYQEDVSRAYGIVDVFIFLPGQRTKRKPVELENRWGSGKSDSTTTTSGGDGFTHDYPAQGRRRRSSPASSRVRRSHQPQLMGRSPATYFRFGGFGLMLIVIIVKAIVAFFVSQ